MNPFFNTDPITMSNDFQALVLNQADGKTTAAVQSLTQQDLPEGDVLVQVDYSSINYKDAMAVTGTGKIIPNSPWCRASIRPVR